MKINAVYLSNYAESDNGINSLDAFRIEQGQYGIFHLSNRESNGGGILPDLSVVFGTGGDIPLAGRWRQQDPPITFTNLRLNSAHKALKAAMFFAIYIELSDDLHFGGREMPISTPTLAFEEVSRQRAEFLTTQIPCRQTPPAGSDPNLSRFDNCEDPRYMFAQTILNGMLNSERTYLLGQGGYSAPDFLTGVAFSYFWANYRGTMGEESSDIGIWDGNCPYSEGSVSYNTYASIIQARVNNNVPTYSYMARWLENYLNNCIASVPNNRIWASYQNRIGPTIERAISDFYAQLPDPTRFDWLTPDSAGAFTYKVPNYLLAGTPKPISIVQVVGCREFGGQTLYSPQWYETEWSNPCVTPTLPPIPVATVFKEAYSTYVPKVAATYPPDFPSILQPVLRFDRGGSNVEPIGPTPQGGYEWTSLVYQQGANLSYVPRYNYDICASRPDIAGCLNAQSTPHVTVTPKP